MNERTPAPDQGPSLRESAIERLRREKTEMLIADRNAAVARALAAEQALEALGRERNAWARQLADAYDERDTARAELEQVRSERSEDRQTVYRIEALIAEWEQLGRADGVHGRHLRRALDGPADTAEEAGR